MKSYTFTANDFRKFKQRVNYWINKLAITGWMIEIEHEQIGDGINAQCAYNIGSKSALFRLTKNTEGDYNLIIGIDTLALHEVLHLALADLVFVSTKGDDDIITSSEHDLINRLVVALKESKSV